MGELEGQSHPLGFDKNCLTHKEDFFFNFMTKSLTEIGIFKEN